MHRRVVLLAVSLAFGVAGTASAAPVHRPPQFVVVSFDGSGDPALLRYWRGVAARAGAHFTFFLSGVYLLRWETSRFYVPPRHARGRSDIGYTLGTKRDVAALERQLAAAYADGDEIGTHYNGHFCGPAGVAQWTAADWGRELAQFDELVFHANEHNGIEPPVRLPFGPSEIVGGRTPCLEGDLSVLYPVLRRHGFRYDASGTAREDEWPRRVRGLWSFPLASIRLVGTEYDVLSMDYNFLANQVGTGSADAERQTYASYLRYFRDNYFGDRAPLSIGHHFTTWNHWAYVHALTRFVARVCGVREVRCVSYRELAGWLDAQPPRRLARFRAGRFPRLPKTAALVPKPRPVEKLRMNGVAARRPQGGSAGGLTVLVACVALLALTAPMSARRLRRRADRERAASARTRRAPASTPRPDSSNVLPPAPPAGGP